MSMLLRKVLRIIYRRYRGVLYRLLGYVRRTIKVRTRHGLLTMSTRDDGIGLYLFRDREYEYAFSRHAIEFLKREGFVQADDVSMLDVGANIGLISIGLILAGQVTRAIAIEPEPDNFALLRRNVLQNSLRDRLLCLQVAVGDVPSVLTMELSPNNPGDHRIRRVPALGATEREKESLRDTIAVESLPLSQVLEQPAVREFCSGSPSLVWVDRQGHEGYFFKGGGASLKGVPTVSEVWPYGILRSGMSLEDFCAVVAANWSDYWVERRKRFTRYPTAVFDRFLDELGSAGHFENIIFTGRPSGDGGLSRTNSLGRSSRRRRERPHRR